jgi:hypothetical protein
VTDSASLREHPVVVPFALERAADGTCGGDHHGDLIGVAMLVITSF